MRGAFKLALAGILLSAGSVLAAGCQADKKADHAMGAPAGQAVTCDKCKVTWVKVADKTDKGRIVSYSSKKSMECPDCKTAVENFFATGKLEHTCKTCGSDLTICESH
jgi:uncharacterized UBP type Zn finger protein